MRKDPFFATPTGIVKGCPAVNPATRATGATDEFMHERAEAIWTAAYAVRTALFNAYERKNGEKADLLPLSEQTDLLLAAFCDRRHRLAHYWDEELAAALKSFRDLIPLVPFAAVETLTAAAIGVHGNDVRRLLQDHSLGQLNDDQLRSQATQIARQACVEFDEEAEPAAAVAALADQIETARKQGPPWKEIADGSESRVYLSEPNQTVYKALPFRGELLHVKPILGDGDIAVGREHGTYLADSYGGMPLFDRARLMAQIPGFCRTELVAISASGLAIYKQPFLGWVEPSPDAIHEWAGQYGHATLPEQTVNADDPVESDITRLPLVAAAPGSRTYVMAMDINPRNARCWNGQAIPFDPVVRELKAEEIASHPGIQEAVETIERGRRRRFSGPGI